jgi:hypothetical protein
MRGFIKQGGGAGITMLNLQERDLRGLKSVVLY